MWDNSHSQFLRTIRAQETVKYVRFLFSSFKALNSEACCTPCWDGCSVTCTFSTSSLLQLCYTNETHTCNSPSEHVRLTCVTSAALWSVCICTCIVMVEVTAASVWLGLTENAKCNSEVRFRRYLLVTWTSRDRRNLFSFFFSKQQLVVGLVPHGARYCLQSRSQCFTVLVLWSTSPLLQHSSFVNSQYLPTRWVT